MKFLKRVKKIFAFTLVELIITIAIISLLASITVVVLDPSTIFKNSRISTRKYTLQTFKSSFSRYISDTPLTSGNILNDFAGFQNLYNNTQAANPSGDCPDGVNGIVSGTINQPFSIGNTNGSIVQNTIDISPLINKNYLSTLPKDTDGSKYLACIDTDNGNSFVIFSNNSEGDSNLISQEIYRSEQVKPPTFVQSKSANAYDVGQPAFGRSVTVTMTNPVTVGNLIAVAVTTWNTVGLVTGINSVTDNKGNSYTKIIETPTPIPNADNMSIWYTIPTTGGSNFQITAMSIAGSTMNYDNTVQIAVHEYSGVKKVDQKIGVMGTNSLTANTGNIITTRNSEVLFACFTQKNASVVNFTTTSPFKQREFQPDDGKSAIYTQDYLVNQKGTFNANGVFDSSVDWTSQIVTFKK